MAEKLVFEDCYETICREIEKRRHSWTISSLDFDDVKQDILIHIERKIREEKFDSKKVIGDPSTGFARWLQGVISSQISNHRRDYLYRWSRPCIWRPEQPRGCPFNSGDDKCSQTPSGKQCSECPIYAEWEKSGKINHHAIKQALPIENHIQEVHSVIEDFTDIAAAKKIIDEKVMEKLNAYERRIYRMILIKGISEEQVGKQLKLKKTNHMHPGYSIIYKIRKKAVRIARQVIEAEGLA